MMNSSPRESPQQQRNLNETKNISTILPPEITSTPFISNKTKVPSPLVTPTKRLLGPRRYALSNNGMLNPRNAIKDPPGPLLASTGYNVNVSTYIDTKSPGYAGRLVQYNEESSRKQQNTHQERYGSPGLFPIVHLFKKDVPVISPKLNKGTVRIGTPESKGYYSQEHSRLLLEGIVQNNSILKEQNNSNEASTRSVLDALKEISRKRIHANEDYDSIDDSNKKFRKSNGEGDYAKRNRVESPTSENANSPPTTQAKKRLCTIDAVLASKTSSMFANYEMSNKRKSTEDSSSRVYPTNKKKFSDVETQTPGTPVIVRELKKTSITKEAEQDKTEEPIKENEETDEITSTPKPVLKVLDDKPLEVIRKNRLGALLSALSGREIPSIPMEDRRKALDRDWPSQSSEKGLVSILSPQKKQTKPADKHVTFNLPESTETTSSSNVSEKSSTGTEVKDDKKSDSNLTQNNYSASLTFSSTNAFQGANESVNTNTHKEPLKTVNNSDNQTKKEEKEKIVGGFKFDLNKAMDSKIKSVSAPITEGKETELPKTKPENNANTSFATNLTQTFGSKPSQPESERTISKSPSQEFSFSKSPSVNSLGLPTSLPNNSKESPAGVSGSSSFSFGAKTIGENSSNSNETAAKESVSFAFGRKGEDSVKPSNNVASPTLGKFGGSGMNSSPFGSKSAASSTFAFMGNGNVPTNNFTSSESAASNISTSTSTVPSFGTVTSSISTATNAPVSTSGFSSKPFGSLANSPPSKTPFEASATSAGGFKFNPGNSTPSFGNPSNSLPVTTSSSVNVKSSTSTLNNVFEASNKTTNAFGSTTTTSAIFGTNSAPNNSFIQGSKPFAFASGNEKSSNNTVTSANSSSTFNFSNSQNTVASSLTNSNLQFTSVANTNNMFSSEKKPASFGTTTTSSFALPKSSFNFTAPNTTTTSNSLFSTSSTPTFGTTNTSAFGNNNTSSFATSTTPSFSSTSTPNFSAASTSSFGAPSTASFVSANPNFGTSNAQTFGNTNTPSFGTNINSTFGAKNTPNLNVGTTNTPSFGTNAPNFGSNSIPNFGTNSTGTFGTTNTPSFSSANTSFNSTSTPSFGTVSSSSFGTSNPSSFATAKPTLFGSSNPPAFGAANADSVGTNNTFGAASTSANAFGTNTPAFGTTTSTIFGATNTPTFGNTTTAPSFGSSFASPSTLNAPSFGNTSSPFGSNVTISNNSSTFGNAPATNSFGSFSLNNNQFTSVTSASAFGTNTNNTFGNATTTNAFAANSTNNTFNSPSSASPFGSNVSSTSTNAFAPNFGKKPEQPSNVFQSSSNNMFNNNASFGAGPSSSSAGTASTSGVFSFGSSNSSAPSTGVFTFGASEPPKSFNFNTPGSSVNAPNPTGFNTVPSFGQQNAAPSFGQQNATPSFGQQNPAVPNMFSIGSGNTSSQSQPRSRPVVRARRRT